MQQAAPAMPVGAQQVPQAPSAEPSAELAGGGGVPQALSTAAPQPASSGQTNVPPQTTGGPPVSEAENPRMEQVSSPAPVYGPPQDLLALVDPTVHCMLGNWVREGKSLRSPGQARTTLVFPFDPPQEFRLVIVARRVQGRESLNVTLPVGNSQTMVVLEGYGRLVSGLSLVSGATADHNETTYFGRIFQGDAPVTLEFASAPDYVHVRASQELIIQWQGDASRLSLDQRFWSHIPPRRIALSVYRAETVFVIDRVELLPGPIGARYRPDFARARPGGPGMGRPSRPFGSPPWLSAGPPPSSPPQTQPEETPSPPETAGVRPRSELPGPPITHFDEQPPEEVTQWKDSVGLIEFPLASGTGFVAKEKLIVTNSHVIEGAFVEDLEITFAGAQEGRYRVQKLLYEDPARDLAILYVDCPQKPIPIAFVTELRPGDKVAIISNPSLGNTELILRNAMVAGQVAARVHKKGYDFYQITANVNPGSSGAPLFNWQGEVVGVIAMKATEEGERELGQALRNLDQSFAKIMPGVIRRGMAFSIPGNALVKAIEEAEKELQQPTGRAADLHAERAIFENLAVAGVLYLLKFAANVPDEVRAQEQVVRMRGVPRLAAGKVKLVELMPEDQARKIRSALDASEAREILAFCTKNLDQRLNALKQSPHVDQNRVKLLESLMRTVNTLKRYGESPPTTYQAYSQAALQQSENLKDQVTRLADSFAQLRPAYAD
ncbi:S1 family peptidase [Thermogutta terrifontis]|nr:serine protease [Thermogutta terrifontis]